MGHRVAQRVAGSARPRLITGISVALSVVAAARGAASQTPRESPLQLEVRDSLGLPLPDAVIEVFAYADRGIFREWLPVDPSSLPPGIHLLRFSHEGFRPSVFSIPLRKGVPVSLRVRLHPTPPTPLGKGVISATRVDAIGLALERRRATDIIGGRRVIAGDAIERADDRSVGELLRLAMGTDLLAEPSGSGTWQFTVRSSKSNARCEMPIMLNGDPTLTLTFAGYQSFYRTREAEAIEFVPRGRAIPHTFRRPDMDCPVLLIWLRGPVDG